MSLSLTVEVKGQYIEATLFTVFDNERTEYKSISRPIRVEESLCDIIDLERIAIEWSFDRFEELLAPNEWSIRIPSFSARILYNYCGSICDIENAWSRF